MSGLVAWSVTAPCHSQTHATKTPRGHRLILIQSDFWVAIQGIDHPYILPVMMGVKCTLYFQLIPVEVWHPQWIGAPFHLGSRYMCRFPRPKPVLWLPTCVPVPYLNDIFPTLFPSPLLSLLPTAKLTSVSEVGTVKEQYLCLLSSYYIPALSQAFLIYHVTTLTVVWPDGYYYCPFTRDKIQGQRLSWCRWHDQKVMTQVLYHVSLAPEVFHFILNRKQCPLSWTALRTILRRRWLCYSRPL